MNRATIDELANLSGVTVRSIRSYQALGMLPGPERVGRIGYYGTEHVARLRLIRSLQERGFSRASITLLVNAQDAGHSLRDVLGEEFEQALTSLTELPPAYEISRDEATAMFGQNLDRAVEIGFLTAERDHYRVWNREMLEIGGELVAIGIPVNVVLDEAEALMQRSDEITQRYVRLFLSQIWQPYVDRGQPDDDLEVVTDQLRRLMPLIPRSVDAAVRQAMAVAVAAAMNSLFSERVVSASQSYAG